MTKLMTSHSIDNARRNDTYAHNTVEKSFSEREEMWKDDYSQPSSPSSRTKRANGARRSLDLALFPTF